MKKKIISIAILLFIVAALLVLANRLLIPKNMSGIVEAALISEYYEEQEHDHDVIFVGDCEVYENFSPITLWQEYGITSFIRGSAQQLIWQSYYLLEETLKFEKPDVAVFNVLSMMYDEPQNEAYNRMTLDGMRMSPTKLKSVEASMLPEETWISYIFPILRYHSRWNELSSEDIQYLFHKEQVSHNGYLMRVDVKPVTSIPQPKKLADYKFGDVCYEYLDKMTELCKKNNVKLVLIKAPSLYPHWYDEWDAQMAEYAKKNDLLYVNFLDDIEGIGLDFNTDTYDGGLHLNLAGAEKLSKYFGKILAETYKLEDRRNDAALSAAWQEKIDFYNQMKDEQYKELEQYGYLKKFSKKKQ